jgi:ParB family chromosome partitioning protein
MLPVESIEPNPHQPRQAIGETELDELADSIREHGVLQPVVVTRARREGRYNLVAGERRWRAAEMAGLHAIPAIVKEASSREMLELALVENLQRADLNPLEQAAAYKSLVEEFGMRQEDVAARVGKSRQAVTNAMRLLQLPAAVQQSLALKLITEGHARAILQAPGETLQIRLAEQTVAEDLSVRQVEELARMLAMQAEEAATEEQEKPHKEPDPLYDEMRDLEERFRNALGTKVQLSRSSRGGRLVIYFYSNEELDRIYGAIVGEEQ